MLEYIWDILYFSDAFSDTFSPRAGYKPKAYIRAWNYVGVDPFEELLLGPTFATEKVLRQMNLTLKDIGVIEFHEAFAGQVLSNITAMASEKFAKDRFSSGNPVVRKKSHLTSKFSFFTNFILNLILY